MTRRFFSGSSLRTLMDHFLRPRQIVASPVLGRVGPFIMPPPPPAAVVTPTLENPLFGYKLSRRRHIKVLFSSGFHRKTDIFHCNYNVESFYFESRPMFLLFTTVVNKPFVIRAWTPYSYSLHTHMQFHIASLPFFICVLWFACRKSLIGKIN